jgi:hypothetical protein
MVEQQGPYQVPSAGSSPDKRDNPGPLSLQIREVSAAGMDGLVGHRSGNVSVPWSPAITDGTLCHRVRLEGQVTEGRRSVVG